VIRRSWPWVDVRAVLDIQAVLLREERRRDNYRILTRQDVDLGALRRRMVTGQSPRVTILDQVAPMWAYAGPIRRTR
jgi:hypothetical protein